MSFAGTASFAVPTWRDRMTAIASWAAVLVLGSCIVSKALYNAASVLLVVCWLLSGDLKSKWTIARNNPLTIPSLALAALVALGTIYTPAPPDYSYFGRYLYVYSRLPIAVILLTIFHDEIWRRRGLAAFAIGAAITLASTYANLWLTLPWSQSQVPGFGVSHHVFTDYIAQGIAMSFFAVFAFASTAREQAAWRRWCWFAVCGLAAFSVTHLLESRTGLAVLAPALTVAALAMTSRRWRAIVLIGLTLAFAIAIASSDLARERIEKAIGEVEHYATDSVIDTSIGARLDMWAQSAKLWASSPIWGNGTGSYRYFAERHYADLDPGVCATSCVHPHNQFLFFGAELGILGAGAYLLLLLLPALRAGQLELPDRILLAGFLTIMLVDSFINAPLWVTTERHFFMAVLPLLAAGLATRPRRAA